jgi:hypothetical protein
VSNHFRPLASALLSSDFFDSYRSGCENAGEYCPFIVNRFPSWKMFEKFEESIRVTIVKWLYEVAKKHTFMVALPLAINILDEYMMSHASKDISAEKIQLFALACYALAVALYYSRTNLDDYSILCHRIFTSKEIEISLWEVFSALKFRVYRKTFIQEIHSVRLPIVKAMVTEDVVSGSLEEQRDRYKILSDEM